MAAGRRPAWPDWRCSWSSSRLRSPTSVGLVGSRVVVLLSEAPRTVGYDDARAALSAAAAALPPPPGL